MPAEKALYKFVIMIMIIIIIVFISPPPPPTSPRRPLGMYNLCERCIRIVFRVVTQR